MWQLIRCADTGSIMLQFQDGANAWWTSLWVRNIALPLNKVSVKSANHADWLDLRRETDGTLNDDSGFGEGSFDLRIEAVDGTFVTVTQPGFEPGSVIVTDQQL